MVNKKYSAYEKQEKWQQYYKSSFHSVVLK